MDNIKIPAYAPDFNNAPYRCIALPYVCEQLHQAGLSGKSILWWDTFKEAGKIVFFLRTFFFDSDRYYQDSQAMVDCVNKPTRIPAYSMADLELLLPPDYILEKHSNGYTLGLHDMWKMEPIHAERLSDCFGLMVLQLLLKRSLRPEHLNPLLERRITSDSAG